MEPIVWLFGTSATYIVLGAILGHYARRDWQVCACVGLIAVGSIIGALAIAFTLLAWLIATFR